jgi:hypothetical protein
LLLMILAIALEVCGVCSEGLSIEQLPAAIAPIRGWIVKAKG